MRRALQSSMIELTTLSDEVFLNVDGTRIAESRKNNQNSYSFSIEEPTPTMAIYACEFGELPSAVDRIFLRSFSTELMEHNPIIEREENTDSYSIAVHSFINLELWSQIYTPTRFIRDLKPTLATYVGIEITEIQNESFGLRLSLPIYNPKTKIGDAVTKIVRFLEESELKAITECLKEEKGKYLATYFSFSENVKTACEQYLLYFGEFLKNVGINASVEINEEADRVLFSVTPADSHEALDRIRQVLELYLELPNVTFTLTEDKEYRLEAQRLIATIKYYESQIILAQAINEQKDATIGLLKERLVLQGEMKEGRLLPEPAQRKEADKEEILGGAVEIKKWEGKGFNVNLPKLFRDLREWAKRDKGKRGL
jgi:hypothetical protein